MMPARRCEHDARRQRGVTSLFVTLIVLLVVMLLGVTAMFLSGTQVKLAGNLQLENVAFNLAEGAVNSAQIWINSTTNYVTPQYEPANAGFNVHNAGTTPELWPAGTLAAQTAPQNDPLTMAWDNTNSKQVVSGDDSQRYLVEMLNTFNQPMWSSGSDLTLRFSHGKSICLRADVYRITARGVTSKGTVKIVQTTYSYKVVCT